MNRLIYFINYPKSIIFDSNIIKRCIFSFCFIFSLIIFPKLAQSKSECRSLDEQPIKIEAWLSKHYRANLDYLRKDFAAMGDTKVLLWEYPAHNPSGVLAIGRCVPAFIARHAINKALTYTKGVNNLVNQGFVYNHWIGIGTNLFSEWAQKRVTKDQVKSLLDNNLSTKEFQSLYRKYTNQDATISGFGLKLPNPKLMHENDFEEN